MDRKQHWEQVYTNKNTKEVSWYQESPTISLQLISASQKNTDLIDIGGGASVLIDHLIDNDYQQLAVLDISDAALQTTKNRLGEKANLVSWFSSDITTFQSPKRFTLWHDRAVFHFLTQATDRQKYLEVLKQTLTPDGALIIAAFAIGGPEKCSGLDIVQYDANKMCDELGDGFQLIEQVSEKHITPANKEQAFIYYRFQRK